MALVFVLALLLDSSCSAACIPVELKALVEHCGGHHGSGSSSPSCDLHGHLKPVVQDRVSAAATMLGEALASPDAPPTLGDPEAFQTSAVLDLVLHVPPLLQRSSVLRI